MEKNLLVINKEDAEAVASILESKAFAVGLKCPIKGCVNVLDSLYYILNPERYNELNQSCALGTCASPEWTCNTCPFANRRPFSENLRMRANIHYRKEIELIKLYKRFRGIWA